MCFAHHKKSANTNIKRNIGDKGIEYTKVQIQILKEILMTIYQICTKIKQLSEGK